MNICLHEMTNEKMHAFFRAFREDPAASAEPVEPFKYDPDWVNAYYKKHQSKGKLHFAIMLGDTVIGDVYLKRIDYAEKSCEMGIYLTSDQYKGNGYGTAAERMIIEYAFDKLGMEVVYADTLIKNKRSQRVLEKAGFKEIRRDAEKCYYECRK